MKLILAALCILGASVTSYGSILPPNDWHLQKNVVGKSNVTEAEFNDVIDKARSIYGPIVRAHGGRLLIRPLWNDDTVNASAMQLFGMWFVNMYGGLARRPEVTLDGFTLVLCHELGHHLAGFAFASGWAANEGQSDYFATHECAKKFWQDDAATNAMARSEISDTPKQVCDAKWDTEEAQNLCYRTMLASKSLADLLASDDDHGVSFDTPDTNTVTSTDHRHPAAQCRLDTYVQGALCDKDFDENVIPGKSGRSGSNNESAERESAQYTCSRSDGYDTGVRPQCWFKSQL